MNQARSKGAAPPHPILFKERMNKPYDPDYAVCRKTNKMPPKLPLFMELGLVMGHWYCLSAAASIPDEKPGEKRKLPFSPNGPRLLRFLTAFRKDAWVHYHVNETAPWQTGRYVRHYWKAIPKNKKVKDVSFFYCLLFFFSSDTISRRMDAPCYLCFF